jgi:hypothetical protein
MEQGTVAAGNGLRFALSFPALYLSGIQEAPNLIMYRLGEVACRNKHPDWRRCYTRTALQSYESRFLLFPGK